MSIFAALILEPASILIGIVVFLIVYIYVQPKRKLPPGPLSLPVVGTIWSHTPMLKPAELFKLSKRHGEVYRLVVNSKTIIILNSYEAIKEAAVTKPLEFANRGVSHHFIHSYSNPRKGGILFRDFDQKGRSLRSTSLSIMRNLGVGRSAMEDVITEQAESLVAIFASANGGSFDPSHKVTACVTNVILHIMLNKKYDFTDNELENVIKDADAFIQEIRFSALFDRFPFLRFIPPFKSSFNRFVTANYALVNYLWKYTKPLISCFQPGEDSTFVDAFLDKKYSTTDEKSIIDGDEFKYLLRDILVAGTETTATSLKWTMLLLANNPEIQDKLQTEIDHAVGRDRPYRYGDKIPYLDAFIWEIQRYCSIVPRAIPHAVSTNKSAQIRGYDVPNDALVFFNLYAVHNDKSTWGDPENFRPERFMNEKGDFVKNSHVIPFSVGKRSCLGELLARQELYIFTAMLLQRFTFLPPEGVDKIDTEPDLAGTRVPKRFQIRAVPRC